ncbi:MAG: M20/M25/M40 family metallo-hydrolase [Desulfovibrionaceae bacterium]|nr:M20/M25/M40 family metallo-hydrolase [Desulfovibrionaceae bacterium]
MSKRSLFLPRLCAALLLPLLCLPLSAQAAQDSALMNACKEAVPAYTDLFKALVSQDSGSMDIAGLSAKKDFLVSRLKALGAEVELLEAAGEKRKGTYNIVARVRGTGKARILLLSHYDTVWPAGEAASRPFTIKDGRICGPGAGDTISGVAGCLTVLDILQKQNYRDFEVLTLFLNADEEIGSFGAIDQIMAEAARHDAAFSTEGGGENGDSVAVACRGGGRVTITVKGKRAHTGQPHLGHNAGVELVRQIHGMLDLADREKWTDCTWSLGSFGTNVNVVPDSATATLQVRIADSSEVERLKRDILERISHVTDPGCTVEAQFSISRPPFEYTGSTAVLAGAARRIFQEEVGRTLNYERSWGSSDANWASQKTPTLEGLGMSSANAHQRSEFSALAPVPDRLYLLARLIQETCEGRTVPIGAARQ